MMAIDKSIKRSTIAPVLILILVAVLATPGKSAVVISRSEVKSSSSTSPTTETSGPRLVSIIPGQDKYPRKRDNILEPEPAVSPEEDTNAGKKRTFTKNQLRPCTFCKFFSTAAPTPKPRIYLNVIRQ
uniref:Putative conserved secreted protein n=1 Tax=Anopheles darlingi TaxID=43151 RepID=A0A2M4DJI5_ANODA